MKGYLAQFMRWVTPCTSKASTENLKQRLLRVEHPQVCTRVNRLGKLGRSRNFWKFFYPQLQAVFPNHLSEVSLWEFYKAINKVERSFIRTDADEVTYNLHVMIRFDLSYRC